MPQANIFLDPEYNTKLSNYMYDNKLKNRSDTLQKIVKEYLDAYTKQPEQITNEAT